MVSGWITVGLENPASLPHNIITADKLFNFFMPRIFSIKCGWQLLFTKDIMKIKEGNEAFWIYIFLCWYKKVVLLCQIKKDQNKEYDYEKRNKNKIHTKTSQIPLEKQLQLFP